MSIKPVGGVVAGAVLMYFLDPRSGAQRRARVVDRVTHLVRIERRFLGKAVRDARSRLTGVVDRVTSRARETDDWVLEDRIRADLGRVVPYASAIITEIRGGIVTVRGSVLAHDARSVVRHLRAVRGVRDVIDHLERHPSADTAILQQRMPGRSGRWAPSVRVGAFAFGASLAGAGIVRRGLTGAAMTAVGGVLATRAAANRPLGQIARYLLGRDGIAVRKTIFVERPVDQVFALWRHLENFPRFMQHVRSVAIDKRDPMRALWSVDGPFGAPLDLETVTTRIIDGREIAWQTTADQAIQHRGSVRFVPTNGGTRVHLELTYRPPGGAFTHAVAHLLGWDPKARIDHDMVRMKGLLEHGHTRAHGAVVSEAALVH